MSDKVQVTVWFRLVESMLSISIKTNPSYLTIIKSYISCIQKY